MPSQRQNGKWCRTCFNEDYRRRNPALPPRPCEHCRTEIAAPKPRSRFCSTTCKNAARIKLDSERRAAIRATRTCEQCGTSIAQMMASARWCSPTCSNKGNLDAHKRRRHKLSSKYGIDQEQFEAILTEQGGKCAICSTDEPRGHGWAVDHCHNTKIVRGILCSPCNTGIGQFHDDPGRLRAGAAYLERFPVIVT